MIRRQLPAYSPVLPSRLVGAVPRCAPLTRTDPSVLSLEQHLLERYAADRAVLTGSGTQALQLALERCKRALGDDVVVALPAYSCYDLVTAAVGAEVRVTFYDIDPVSLAPDEESLREALAAGAGVVVAGNLYGFPLDWDALRAVCDPQGVIVVEDAAQGLGSRWKDKEAGGLGDLSVLSFGRGKGWNGGGGGALLVRDGGRPAPEPEVSEAAPATAGLEAVVLSLAMWALGRPELYRLPSLIPGLELGATVYHEPEPVQAMHPVSAAIARRHAGPSRDAGAVRAAWAERWHGAVAGGEGGGRALTPCVPLAGGASGWLRCPVLASSAEAREERVAEAGDMGAARGYPTALPRLPQAAALHASGRTAVPGAERLAATLLTLPTHPRVSDADLEAFASVAAKAS
ncbi:MAG: aminotransferase class I/II-fold pyridoxal phosphate-dependent enzyme [Gemmatimonadota bacterium]|nr:aminotransferase class I/II-fold pyridoxal phosphate-dependent enzyme [Gemmatimonadota bacterium]